MITILFTNYILLTIVVITIIITTMIITNIKHFYGNKSSWNISDYIQYTTTSIANVDHKDTDVVKLSCSTFNPGNLVLEYLVFLTTSTICRE